MFKAEQIVAQYVPSSTIEKQGKKKSIDGFLRQGYYVKVSRNGYWVLVKPAEVIVTVYCGKNGNFTFDMKEDILKKYNQSRISKKLVDTFKSDFANKKLSIEVDDCSFYIK